MTMSLSEVSNILWRERLLLDLLTFKLEEEQLVLASGRTRWLSRASREVESILEEFKRVELERAMASAGAISEFGLADAPTLRELVAIAPPPWDSILSEHRRALVMLSQGIEAITQSSRDESPRYASVGEIDIDAYEASVGIPDRSVVLRLVDRAI
jgi:hypothetical protein